jgi:hypothetical protein
VVLRLLVPQRILFQTIEAKLQQKQKTRTAVFTAAALESKIYMVIMMPTPVPAAAA